MMLLSPAFDPTAFPRLGGIQLRNYQRSVLQTLVRAVLNGEGGSYAVLFPRQSGKNELQAQLEALLLAMHATRGGEIIQISPTLRPQAQIAMRRLQSVLHANPITRGRWRKNGAGLQLGNASVRFLSAAPESNIVGATASLLLSIDEAQDVDIEKYDREIAPMAAATNAVRVFWGTAWTSQTLLARELAAARQCQQRTGCPHAFVVTADQVSREVPAYAHFVADQIARLGRDSLSVRTQFFCEEVESAGGMFPPERRQKMCAAPSPDTLADAPLALLVDVGGEQQDAHTEHDATTLTLVRVQLHTLTNPLLRAPTYCAIERHTWVGVAQADLFAHLLAIAQRYPACRLVIDATGIGAGLASFLERALPHQVIPFHFNAVSKSRLGWDFLALVDAGRWQEADPAHPLAAAFFDQLTACRYQVRPGPAHLLQWGVPETARTPHGDKIHDDWVISAALATLLDAHPWHSPHPGFLLPAPDPLADMRGF